MDIPSSLILTWDSQVEQAIKAVNKIYPSYTKNIEVIKYEVGGGSAEYYALVQQKLANNPEVCSGDFVYASAPIYHSWKEKTNPRKNPVSRTNPSGSHHGCADRILPEGSTDRILKRRL